jgi:hypothetical protein
LVVNNVGADGVEEATVVGDDHAGDVRLSAEVCEREEASGPSREERSMSKQPTVLEPFDRLAIEMVGRLVEKEEIDLHEHGAAERDAGKGREKE